MTRRTPRIIPYLAEAHVGRLGGFAFKWLVADFRSDPRLPSDAPAVAVVHNDEERIGAMAAEFLVSLGSFRSFAFVPVSQPYAKLHVWSERRATAFRAHLEPLGHPVTVFRSAAAWDERAGHVLAACERLGIRVPDQIAVIGVDNKVFRTRCGKSLRDGRRDARAKTAAQI